MVHNRKCAGLLYGNEPHHIDHLAIICHIMAIPLLVTDEEIERAVKKYYPKVDVILLDYLTIANFLVSTYDIIFYSIPRDLFDEIFFFAQKLLQKKIHTIWCPHGNSDKGNNIPYLEALKKEEIALVYGPKMIDFLKRKGVFNQLKASVITGNFRLQFYLKNKAFYDNLVAREILRKLPSAEKTLLYAPTWQDYEKSSSFYDATIPLIEHLPENWNLIIKPHPNLSAQDEFKIQELCERYESHSQVLFLNHFPPIYPLLNSVDMYIGDMSSIGYDFLYFDKPLFFLNQTKKDAQTDLGTYLFRCGVQIEPEHYDQIHDIIARFLSLNISDFSKIRAQVYHETFAPLKEFDALRREIEGTFIYFPDPELNFF